MCRAVFWANEYAAAALMKVLSFGDLGDRSAQLGQVAERLAMETLVHHHTDTVHDPRASAAQNNRAASDCGRISLCRSPLALLRRTQFIVIIIIIRRIVIITLINYLYSAIQYTMQRH